MYTSDYIHVRLQDRPLLTSCTLQFEMELTTTTFYINMKDIIHVAYQIENLKRVPYKRAFNKSFPRSRDRYSSEKTANKPQDSGVTSASSKPIRDSTPPRARNTKGAASKGKGVQYFHCQGYAHFLTQCPKHVMALSDKQPLAEDVHFPLQALPIIMEAKQARKMCVNLKKISPLSHPLLTTREENKKEDWRRNSIFHTRVLLQWPAMFYSH